MKNIVFTVILIQISSLLVSAQSWGKADDCHINVNSSDYSNLPERLGAIESTVKLKIYGVSSDGEPNSWKCSGVLINRNTLDKDVGYYVLTAKHCMDDIDIDAEHFVIFNYQSPDGESDSTPKPNRGIRKGQSTSLSDNRYEYNLSTKLRLVNSFTWGDMALFEILTPIPPHFNVTYAGWNPNRFGTVISSNHNPTDFYGVHHPRGDIKKISGTNDIVWLENPIATGCYTITTIIDVLFGWIWGNEVSTSVICNYVDNPWLIVPDWQYGIVEHGSSGSGLFDSGNQLMGVLSGSLATCDIPAISTYGKFHANFSNASIKNTLNPNHDVWVDMFGMDERKIFIYDNLTLPGVNGYYFPSNHYQLSNKVILRARNKIKTTEPITVYKGGDYEFIAGKSIILKNGFTVQAGCNFVAKIDNSSSKNVKPSLNQKIIDKLTHINLPKNKMFDSEKYSLNNFNDDLFEVQEPYPNPNNGNFIIKIINRKKNKEKISVEIVNINGRICYLNSYVVEGEKEISISKKGLQKGVYFLKVSSNRFVTNKKIIVTEI